MINPWRTKDNQQERDTERLAELLYQAAFERRPDPEGIEHYKARLLGGVASIASVLEEMLGSAERRELETQRRKENRSVNKIVQQHKSHLFSPKQDPESGPPVLHRTLSQIYISDGCQDLPSLLRTASESTRECFKDHDYHLYTKDTTRQFIFEHYGQRVVGAYDKLAPYAYKADLARYCIVNTVGGWYADLSLLASMSVWPIPPEIGMVYFADKGEKESSKNLFRVQPGLFYSQPNNLILEQAIEMIVKHCETEYYGHCPLSPTGPELLGRAIAGQGIEDNHIIGEFKALTPDCEQENKAYVLPTGEIIALYKTTWAPCAEPGQLTSMGASGTNDYGTMWQQRMAYNKSDPPNPPSP